MPAMTKAFDQTGRSCTLTPEMSTIELEPERTEWTAWSAATSEDEHAVSMATDGPCRSRQYEMRLAAIETDHAGPM
eukprot:342941-Prymnesium_polylepis.1